MFDNVLFFEELVCVLCYVLIYYEILKGMGYLCKLFVGDLLIFECVLVFVDIFEVLIVVDRFYKKVKLLSVVIDILVKMVVD